MILPLLYILTSKHLQTYHRSTLKRERVQKQKTPRKREEQTSPQEEVVKGDALRGKVEEISFELDELLDEIDGVLEENAEEFVKNYVQKGGE